jgi:hypothetical protein
MVAEDDPRPIREINPKIPKWLASVVESLHAKNPDDRFQSARAVAEVFESHLTSPQAASVTVSRPVPVPEPTPHVVPSAPTSSPPASPPARRPWSRLAGCLVSIVVLAFLGSGIFGLWHNFFAGGRLRVTWGDANSAETNYLPLELILEGDSIGTERIRPAQRGGHTFHAPPGKYRLKAFVEGRVIQEDEVVIRVGRESVVSVAVWGTLTVDNRDSEVEVTLGQFGSEVYCVKPGQIVTFRMLAGTHGWQTIEQWQKNDPQWVGGVFVMPNQQARMKIPPLKKK